MRALAALAAAGAALGIARLLPEHGLGLALRLAAATLLVLGPGAAVARALGRGGAAASLAWALTVLAGALAITFAVGASLTLTLVLGGAAGLAALAASFVAQSHGPRVCGEIRVGPWPAAGRTGLVARSHDVSGRAPWSGAVLAAGVGVGIALWAIAGQAQGDALFHLARVRKLADLGSLSLHAVGEFRDAGLHPGYAFPLWHGFLACVARLAGVDPTAVVRHEAAVLAPLALLVGYEAGWGLFRASGPAVAVVLAQLALIVLAPGDGGGYRGLALPATAARQVLAFAALAVAFEAVRSPSAATLATTAAAALALALVHPTYAVFLLVPFGGFLAARALLAPRDAGRVALALAALALPTAAVSFWLLPIVRDTASHNPSRAVLLGPEHGAAKYPGQLDVFPDGTLRLAPEVLTRTGAVAVAALVLVPLAALAWRRRWAAFVLGGSLAVLVLVLIPSLFTRLADAASLSQARRAAGFVPLSFAFAGGAEVLATLTGVFVLPIALAAGIALQLSWPGDFGYRLEHGGPAAVAWIALVGGAVALVAVALLRRPRLVERHGLLTALAAMLFVIPVGWHVSRRWSAPAEASGQVLSDGLVTALRNDVPERAVVFSDPETSYRIAAFAPVYLAVAPAAHVADTKQNRSHRRVRDARRFFRTGSLAIPRGYGATYLVIDRRRSRLKPHLRVVYRDGRYTLYRL